MVGQEGVLAAAFQVSRVVGHLAEVLGRKAVEHQRVVGDQMVEEE